MNPKVAIVILNWNGWQDTLECIKSVFLNDYSAYQVIVCDNASDDNSVAKIREWCESEFDCKPYRKIQNQVINLSPSRQPKQFIVVDQEEVESDPIPGGDKTDVIIICNSSNLGFAGGNNVGITVALSLPEIEYVWLLNNDTQVDRHALIALVSLMEQNKRIGICGSIICDYYERMKVQYVGGIFNRWIGTIQSVGSGLDIREIQHLIDKPDFRIDYPAGASMLLSRSFLQEVGLMCEEYFLYYEELDWVLRADRRFEFSVSPESFVFHKEGASIGSNIIPRRRSLLSDYYLLRNRLLVAKKFFPTTLPMVWIALFLTALNRFRRGQWRATMLVLRIAFTGGRTKFNTTRC